MNDRRKKKAVEIRPEWTVRPSVAPDSSTVYVTLGKRADYQTAIINFCSVWLTPDEALLFAAELTKAAKWAIRKEDA